MKLIFVLLSMFGVKMEIVVIEKDFWVDIEFVLFLFVFFYQFKYKDVVWINFKV